MRKTKHKKKKRVCEGCGTTEKVVTLNCPYSEDVYNEVRVVDLCPQCIHQRVMDI